MLRCLRAYQMEQFMLSVGKRSGKYIDMEEVIIRVGLPVKCHVCGIKGKVKPGTDYDGWAKLKDIFGLKWFCPDHAGGAERLKHVPLSSIPKEQTQADDLTELMTMI